MRTDIQTKSVPTPLNNLPFDPELTPGARNAVRACLRIQPAERVTVITDEVSREIAASVVREIESVGAAYQSFVLEEYGERPLTNMPADILRHLEGSQVSIFIVQVQ